MEDCNLIQYVVYAYMYNLDMRKIYNIETYRAVMCAMTNFSLCLQSRYCIFIIIDFYVIL